MSAFLQLTLALALIILAAKAGGYVAVRLRQPAVLGELLAGLMQAKAGSRAVAYAHHGEDEWSRPARPAR